MQFPEKKGRVKYCISFSKVRKTDHQWSMGPSENMRHNAVWNSAKDQLFFLFF
jgi:hypothetical protein